MARSTAVWALIGAISGVSADQALNLTFGTWDRLERQSAAQTKLEHKNIERVLAVWGAKDGKLEEKAAFTLVLIQSKMISKPVACSLFAYLAGTEDARRRLTALIAKMPEGLGAEVFNKVRCNYREFIKRQSAPADKKRNVSGTHLQGQISCPSGLLYTQFATTSQLKFGQQIATKGKGFRITQPELIKGFDAQNVVVRYFTADKKDAAIKWHDYLEENIIGVDVKFAYVPGYEDKMAGKNQFELWWPKGINAPNIQGKFKCK